MRSVHAAIAAMMIVNALSDYVTGRYGDTKEKILLILKEKNRTLTDLSEMLNKKIPTISQHLNELVELGLIRKIERIHNWGISREKYYEVVEGRPPLIEVHRNAFKDIS